MSKTLSIKDIEDAAIRSLSDFGFPDELMMSSGLLNALMFGYSDDISQTHKKIKTYFTGTKLDLNDSKYRDFKVMSSAATAFSHIGLNKDNDE